EQRALQVAGDGVLVGHLGVVDRRTAEEIDRGRSVGGHVGRAPDPVLDRKIFAAKVVGHYRVRSRQRPPAARLPECLVDELGGKKRRVAIRRRLSLTKLTFVAIPLDRYPESALDQQRPADQHQQVNQYDLQRVAPRLRVDSHRALALAPYLRFYSCQFLRS